MNKISVSMVMIFIVTIIMINTCICIDTFGQEANIELLGYDEINSIKNNILPMLPDGFVENVVQYDDEVLYYAKLVNGMVFVTSDGLVYSLSNNRDTCAATYILREMLSLNDPSEIKALKKKDVSVNYFKGNHASGWGVDIPVYSSLEIGEVFEGISLSLRMVGGECEKVFTVEPSVNPSKIEIGISSVQGLGVNKKGELVCRNAKKSVFFSKPEAYQIINDKRIDVSVKYRVSGHKYSFNVGSYDPKYQLIIDPMLASSYLGGSSVDECYGVEISSSKYIYVYGTTWSYDYPTVEGSYESYHSGGDTDLFISLMDQDLTTLIRSTYLGGSGNEYIVSHAGLQEYKGAIYLTAGSSSKDYPTTLNAYNRQINGSGDVVVSCLSELLDNLIASTYLGSPNSEFGVAINVSNDGNVYVAGDTLDMESLFPTTDAAYDSVSNGSWDIFVSKFDSNLSSLLKSTLLGGGQFDRARCIYLDEGNMVYIAGGTGSSDFPTTPGAYDITFNEDGGFPDHDIFVSCLNGELSELHASTFIGGEDEDMCLGMVMDDEAIILGGHSASIDYPTTPGVYMEEKSGYNECVVTKISKELEELVSSSFVGWNGPDYGNCVAIDDAGYIFLAGWTASSDIAVPSGSLGAEKYDDIDPFVFRLDNKLQQLNAAAILGGNASFGGGTIEECTDVEIIDGSKVVVCGRTHTYEYPTTTGAYSEKSSGYYDAFITIMDELMSLHSGKIIVGPGYGYENPPLLRIYTAAQDALYGFEFSGYGSPHFGINVACGNIDNDEPSEILTGPGPGDIYGPHVRGFEIDGTPLPGLSFLAYGTNKYGVNVAAGDLDGDGFDEIITGAGPGEVFGPHA